MAKNAMGKRHFIKELHFRTVQTIVGAKPNILYSGKEIDVTAVGANATVKDHLAVVDANKYQILITYIR